MGYSHRLAWLTGLARFIGYPALVLTAALRLARPDRLPNSRLLLGALYVLAVPAFWGFRNVVREGMRQREAKRLGARTVPKVKGKWPGNIDLMIKLVKSTHTGYVAEVWGELAKEYGNTFNMRVLWSDMVVTMDHDVIKYMLATGFNSFGKGRILQDRFESLLGDGIFNRDGELWKFHRNMTRPFFVRERISELDLFDNYTQKLLARIGECVDEGVPVDVQDLFARLTIDAAGEFLFSTTSLDTLSLPLPIAYKAEIGPRGTAAPASYGAFVSSFDEAQAIIPVRGRMGPYVWPVAEWKGDKVWKHRCVVDEWIKPLIDSAIQRREAFLKAGGEKTHPAGDTFIDHLVSSTEDRTLIMDELVNILLAARDTTASLLTFATYLLTQHPNVLNKLRAEVLEHVGPDAAPAYDQVKGMKYLRATLNETLRLFPSVPINERATLANCSIPTSSGRLYIPAGTQTIYSPLLMQRRKDLWGPDAWEFDPERWLDSRNEAFVKDPMRFVPFNAGPRICLGQQFAYNEASFVLVRILQKFPRLELAMDAAPKGSVPPAEWRGQDGRKGFERVWVKNAVTLYSKGGMWVRAGRA
ncbi:cytochrome P450 monooxygenase pc-3 [Rhizoctonia solani]|nr:cytochrome P450 monooxygenase pc-3 [Rhizoctonia solani]